MSSERGEEPEDKTRVVCPECGHERLIWSVLVGGGLVWLCTGEAMGVPHPHAEMEEILDT